MRTLSKPHRVLSIFFAALVVETGVAQSVCVPQADDQRVMYMGDRPKQRLSSQVHCHRSAAPSPVSALPSARMPTTTPSAVSQSANEQKSILLQELQAAKARLKAIQSPTTGGSVDPAALHRLNQDVAAIERELQRLNP